MAVTSDDVWKQYRYVRNALLRGSDWTQLPDSPLTDAQKQAWKTYRQALRDLPVTNQNVDVTDPNTTISWPTKPA